MIDETRAQLVGHKGAMSVSFVLLSSQQDVYDCFVQYLFNIPIVDGTATRKPPRLSNRQQQQSAQWQEKGEMNGVKSLLLLDHSLLPLGGYSSG